MQSYSLMKVNYIPLPNEEKYSPHLTNSHSVFFLLVGLVKLFLMQISTSINLLSWVNNV